jgi:hypothetical protein
MSLVVNRKQSYIHRVKKSLNPKRIFGKHSLHLFEGITLYIKKKRRNVVWSRDFPTLDR